MEKAPWLLQAYDTIHEKMFKEDYRAFSAREQNYVT